MVSIREAGFRAVTHPTKGDHTSGYRHNLETALRRISIRGNVVWADGANPNPPFRSVFIRSIRRIRGPSSLLLFS
jgi:hypothetical protein